MTKVLVINRFVKMVANVDNVIYHLNVYVQKNLLVNNVKRKYVQDINAHSVNMIIMFVINVSQKKKILPENIITKFFFKM